ncbi:hypothetical protein Naga_100276g3 [Nannochloropsis gaditana]|uniref:Uncharacterized protein n=1 Tax=Nannochloropsis gaditana TaxID=72520 RepID=W7UB67_9STRA|nr:hypothetical protein Naga_100276g3 [Nannochloropsis gaditana]
MRFGRVCVCPLLTLVVLCLVCEGSSTRAIHWVKTGARSKQGFLFQSRDLFRGEEVAGNKESQSRAVAAWVRKKENGNDDGEKPRKPQKGKSRKANKNSPRPPVFTARIAILGSPSEEWGQGVRERLISEGWMEERVQVLPIPSPQAYPEAKWMAYLREGLKLRNTTFVIAAPGPAVGQVLRFLEKHPLRGSILLGPEASSDTRSWDYKRLRQHCPFFGLIYAMEGEEEEYVGVGPGDREGARGRGRQGWL